MSEEYPSESLSTTVPNSTLALVSLISGILGLSLIPVIGSIIAVVTGYMARREIQESAGTLSGENLATVGLVLGWIGIGLAVLAVCVVLVAFALFFGVVSQTVTTSSLPGILVSL